LAHRLQNKSLTIAVSNDLSIRSQDQFYPFRQNSDLFYLTGIEQPETTLVLFSEHESNLHEILFIKPLNPEWETWNGKLLTKEEASEISGIENVLYNTEFDEMIAELLNDCDVILLNYNDKPTSDLAQFLQPNRIKQKLQETHPHIAFEPLSLIINEIRTIKEQAEIELINKACEITGKAFREIVKHIKPNITEFEIEAIILSEFIKNRAIQAFNTIVASGKNACTLHYTDNNGICTEGELVLIDFGADYVYYASDCTRTLPVNGKFSPRQKEVYQAVLRILKAITSVRKNV
jgi:Xaa-Pro aminopeptidase